MKWNFEKWVAISSMFVSLLTLIFFLYQIDLSRKQQLASAWPYLALSVGYENDLYRFQISNEGLGPAFVTSVFVETRGVKHPGDVQAFLSSRYKIKKADSLDWLYGNIYPGQVIAASKSINIMQARNSKTGKFLLETIHNDTTIIEVQYKSVYDEVWRLRSDNPVPEKVE